MGVAEMAVRLSVGRSRIQGKGVFAAARIFKRSFVLKCSGRVVDFADVTDGMRAMQIDADKYLVENPECPSIDDFLNHSCAPNLGFLRGDLALYALRDIDRGEELMFDYSATMNESGWSMKCRCGSVKCRTHIRSYGDLFEHERMKLRQIALSYLREGWEPGRSVAVGTLRQPV